MAIKNIDGDVKVEFTEPAQRQTLDSGESAKTLFGKISKWLRDLKAVAFSGSYNDLTDKPTMVTGVKGSTESGYRTGNVNLTAGNVGAVSKNGDTMNGNLVSSGAQLRPKSTNINRDGTLPSSATTGNGYVRFLDADDEGIGLVRMQWQTSGKMSTQMYALNETEAGVQVDNYISVEVDKTGTRTYVVADPSAFRTSIGAAAQSQLNTSETSDTTPYIYKSSEHDAVYDELVGGSVAWNQLIGASWDSLNKTEGTTFTQNSDGTLHISGTGSGLHFCNSEIEGGLVNGHKYWYSMAGMKAGITSQIYSTTSGSARYIVTSTTNSDGIFTYTAQASDISQFARFYTDTSYSGTTDLKYILIDLTQMFGSTIADYVYNLEQSTAGSGIAWLKSYGFFTKDYYAYNAGGFVSANTSGKRIVGKNQFFGSIENGVIYRDGIEVSYIPTRCKSMSYVPVRPNTTYTFSLFNNISGVMAFYAIFYNFNKEYLGIVEGYPLSSFTTPQNAAYVRFDFYNNNNNLTPADVGDVQLELGSTATDYEPYTSITYPIKSTDLRGLYKLNGSKLYTDGDIYSADGQITRKYGIVDLGTLNWNANGSYGEGQYEYAAVISGKANGVINMICTTLIVQSTASLNCIRGRASSSNVSAVSSETTKEAFKTAMSGVYLIYELATPTTETAQPFTSPQIVYRNGTEEYLDARDVTMPVGGNRKYVDIPEWMVNEYFDDVRAEASNVSDITNQFKRFRIDNRESDTVALLESGTPDHGLHIQTTDYGTYYQVAPVNADSNFFMSVFANRFGLGYKRGSMSTVIQSNVGITKDGTDDHIGAYLDDYEGTTLKLRYANIYFNSTKHRDGWKLKPSIFDEYSGQSHNCIWRGKYLGDTFTAEQKAAIANGTFKDMYVGDYWTINSVDWVIADINYYYGHGDTACWTNHLVIVPRWALGSSQMNPTATTAGGYLNSAMRTTILKCDSTTASDTNTVYGKICAAFGESNILSHRLVFSNAIDANGNASSWEWTDSKVDLLNQSQIFGQKAWVNGTNDGYNVGIQTSQLAAFRLNHNFIIIGNPTTRISYWTSDVRTATFFVYVAGRGNAGNTGANNSYGVRPHFCLCGYTN